MTESQPGTTEPAGAGVSDAEFAKQVAGQTASDLEVQPVFEREHDGAATTEAIADADADDLGAGASE